LLSTSKGEIAVEFLSWLESLPISDWVATSDWGYALMLSVHSIGMAAIVGLLLVLDFRVLGYATAIPISAFRKFTPYAWTGFLLNLISGVLLFTSTASRLVSNWPFLAKMACIAAAGVTTYLLWRELQTNNEQDYVADSQGGVALLVASSRARILAALSTGLWIAAIVFGRLIAYVMDHAILNGQ
jgi:hypothetical protein